MSKFKQRVETEVKEYNETNIVKFSQVRLSLKQATDMIYDLQKQEKENRNLIDRQGAMIETHQRSIEEATK